MFHMSRYMVKFELPRLHLSRKPATVTMLQTTFWQLDAFRIPQLAIFDYMTLKNHNKQIWTATTKFYLDVKMNLSNIIFGSTCIQYVNTWNKYNILITFFVGFERKNIFICYGLDNVKVENKSYGSISFFNSYSPHNKMESAKT